LAYRICENGEILQQKLFARNSQKNHDSVVETVANLSVNGQSQVRRVAKAILCGSMMHRDARNAIAQVRLNPECYRTNEGEKPTHGNLDPPTSETNSSVAQPISAATFTKYKRMLASLLTGHSIPQIKHKCHVDEVKTVKLMEWLQGKP
jgi:hypothetical protein